MRKFFVVTGWLVVIGVALCLRTAGIYRGLDADNIYHPDEPKQVLALESFLDNHYVRHIGNVYYDGYPYGLNHVDELILRPYFFVRDALSGHLRWSDSPSVGPGRDYLYYAARSLRVLYGMLCLLIAWLISRRLSFSKSASWFLLLLLAMAPVSVAVAHFATGDVGTDLFAGLTILFLCLYAERGRNGWLFATGLSAGMAFACKYNGLLCGIAPGMYLILKLLHTRNWRQFLNSALILLCGTLAGIVILTPNLLLDSRRAAKDMLANFVFIQQYGGSDEFYRKTFFEKVSYILTVNLFRVVRQMGWYVFVAALLSLLVTGARVISAIKNRFNLEDAWKNGLIFSITACPFAAMILSLVGKPEVQPFHFSYLQLPLAIGAVYCVGWLGGNASVRPARIAILVLMVAMVAELGIKARKDLFFWSKHDNSFLFDEMSRVVLRPEAMNRGRSGVVRDIFIEPESAGVFRNRRREIALSGGEFWRALQIAPVPSVPWPAGLDWIFANGPVFPRSDRMFEVPRDTGVTKHIVFHERPESVTIGVRSGSWPVEVRFDIGGVLKKLRLAPDSQELLTVNPLQWRTVDDSGGSERKAHIVPLSVRTLVGDAYVAVCINDGEAEAFRFFGGESVKNVFDLPSGLEPDRVVAGISRTRYFESRERESKLLYASVDDEDMCIIPRCEGNRPVAFPLPCGAFRLEYEAVGMSDGDAEVEMWIGDFRNTDAAVRQCIQKQTIRAGRQIVQYRFSKTFAPYQCCVVIRCVRGAVRIDSWELVPDAGVILKDVQNWRRSGNGPDWLRRHPLQGDVKIVDFDREICFGGAITLRSFYMPEKLVAGEQPKVRCRMDLKKFPFAGLDESFVFVHLLDNNGRQVYATGFPAACAFSRGGGEIVCNGTPPCDIPAGEYDVVIGIWNSRTGKRLSVSGENTGKAERRKRYIRVGKVIF